MVGKLSDCSSPDKTGAAAASSPVVPQSTNKSKGAKPKISLGKGGKSGTKAAAKVNMTKLTTLLRGRTGDSTSTYQESHRSLTNGQESDEELDDEDIQPETCLKGNYPTSATDVVTPVWVEEDDVPCAKPLQKQTVSQMLGLDSDIDMMLLVPAV